MAARKTHAAVSPQTSSRQTASDHRQGEPSGLQIQALAAASASLPRVNYQPGLLSAAAVALASVFRP